LKRSGGDIDKIDALVEQALGGCFNVLICKGLKTCPYIPDECREEVIQMIEKHESAISLISFDSNTRGSNDE
jgi:hypothetical protein